jgi:hypothetical protein
MIIIITSLRILWIFSVQECSSEKCTVTFPFCTLCLSKEYGLAIRSSLIHGAVLGLFSTRDFSSGEFLELEYTGKINYQYLGLKIAAKLDLRAARKLDYVMEFNSSYIDASDENGGPIHYIIKLLQTNQKTQNGK